jgi:5'(3')-deoxyribonucleotidase
MSRRAPLRLGIDLDGVVADFNTGWIRLYNAEFGSSLTTEQVTMWGAPMTLTHFESMGEFWRWASRAANGVSIFRVLVPFPGALEALHRLAVDHSIVIVTTKPQFAIGDTFEWLEEHALPTREVHIVDDKPLVDCDLFLEDADHNLEALRDRRPDSIVCRYVRPWNRPHEGVVDVEDWADFEQVVAAA